MIKCEQDFLLSNAKKTYKHHPRWFLLQEGDKYMPDFYCNEDDEYIEVAGTRQAYHANKEKYCRFTEQYPYLNFCIYKLYNNSIEKYKSNGNAESEYNHNQLHAMMPNEIAAKYNVSPAFISMMKRGDKFTEKRELAKAVSALTGKRAILYIPARLRPAFSAIDPSLDSKFKWETVLLEIKKSA